MLRAHVSRAEAAEKRGRISFTASHNVTYTYLDATSLVDSVVETIDGTSATSTYEYDKQGRLVEYTPGFPSGYGTIVYEYNSLGQKTSMTVPLGVNNKAKKICYSYDSEGKLVGTHVLPATATSSVSTATSDPGDLRFHYDDNGNRVELINQDGDVYYFVYDPTASIPAVLVEIEATGSSQYLNIREPDGSLVSRETYNDSGTMTCHRTYHFDGLGSVVALSDEDGTLTDKYTYGEWGNVLTHTDPDTGDAIGLTLDNPYQYVGQYGYYTHHQQTDFKLLQLGVRYYDPETGRFTQKDPAKDGLNWYAYVNGRVTGSIDPTGTMSTGQCETIEKVLECERKYGTWYCAKLHSNTFGGDPLGAAFVDGAVPTAYGIVDLDWWTDLRVFGGGYINREYNVLLYIEARLIWKGVCVVVYRMPQEWPFEDPKEINSMRLLSYGIRSYKDLFPPEFMHRECGTPLPELPKPGIAPRPGGGWIQVPGQPRMGDCK